MKNIHVIPTEKPSRLHKIENEWGLTHNANSNPFAKQQNIYITSDEYIGLSYYLDGNLVRKGVVDDKEYWEARKGYKKIILTTDPQLIADGIQDIDEEFLQWFVKNPTCKVVKIDLIPINEFGSDITLGSYGFDKFKYKIIIPQEEPKLETLEEAAERLSELQEGTYTIQHKTTYQHGFIDGAKCQAERGYSEEYVKLLMAETWIRCVGNDGNNFKEVRDKILKQFKKQNNEQ